MPPSADERLAVIEAEMKRDAADREIRRQELDDQLRLIHMAIEANAREMARYKGVVGGISLAVSMLWAGVVFFKETLVQWLSKG